MNIYDILPKDIWVHILLDLPCKYIRNFYDISIECKNLCIKENIIERRKIKGFPRMTGQCENFQVENFILFIPNEILYNTNICDHQKFNIIFDNILTKLYDDNVDLVYGDIVNIGIFNGIFIFDGEKFIDLYKNINTIIPLTGENTINVPVKYWRHELLQEADFIFDILKYH